MTIATWLPAVLGYLLPMGVLLMGWGGVKPRRARHIVTLGSLALAIAVLGYYAVGFGVHLGGAAVMAPDQPGLEGLRQAWGPSREWAILGTTGFFLRGDTLTSEVLALFVLYVPMAATAVLLPVLSLGGRARPWQAALGGLLVALIVFPLAASWVWGGGWLSQLGRSLSLGFGTVDYAGSITVFLLGGAFALGGLLGLGRRLPIPDPDASEGLPPAHFPLLASLGALLFGVGWLGWSLSAPFHASGADLNLPLVAVNGLLAWAAASLASLAYAYLATGEPDPLLAARGAATGLIAVSAAAPFIPPWSALVTGAAAGLLFPLGVYLSRRILRVPDATGAVPMGLVGGLVGAVAVPIFADGRWGWRWNGLTLDESHLRAGQGVVGYFPASGLGFLPDGNAQLAAQLAGVAAVLVLSLLSGLLLFLVLAAWQRHRDRRRQASPVDAETGAVARPAQVPDSE